MSMKQGRAQFEMLLSERENRVVALTGRWGSGKTYMWRELQARSPDPSIQGALYVSLFGLSTITELKLKAAQGVLPVDARAPWAVTAGAFARIANKVARGFHASFSALDEIALLAVPKMLEGRFIVIDDIERKHEKLSIDEVLGFIDDFTQNHRCRMLLILNTDQLADKTVWEKFREKVIDEELRLETSPAEAFDIASVGSRPDLDPGIREAVEVCSLNNIRVVRKVIRVVDRILRTRPGLNRQVLARVVPSTVLLAAIHYKGIDGGPGIDYVLGHGSGSRMRRALAAADEEVETLDAERAASESTWDLLLERLGFYASDEYEAIVAGYLASGQVDPVRLDAILDRYCSEENLVVAQARAQSFFQRARWHPDLTDADLLAEAGELLPMVHLLPPSTVTNLHEEVSKLGHGEGVARDMIGRWVEAFNARPLSEADAERFEDEDVFDRRYHPDLVAAYEEVGANLRARRSLADVLIGIATFSAWGPREEAAMKSATPADFEAAIRSLTGTDLKHALVKGLDLYRRREMYARHFGSAMDNFVAACRKIYADEPDSRWAALLKAMFEEAKMGSALEEGITPSTPDLGAAD